MLKVKDLMGQDYFQKFEKKGKNLPAVAKPERVTMKLSQGWGVSEVVQVSPHAKP